MLCDAWAGPNVQACITRNTVSCSCDAIGDASGRQANPEPTQQVRLVGSLTDRQCLIQHVVMFPS